MLASQHYTRRRSWQRFMHMSAVTPCILIHMYHHTQFRTLIALQLSLLSHLCRTAELTSSQQCSYPLVQHCSKLIPTNILASPSVRSICVPSLSTHLMSCCDGKACRCKLSFQAATSLAMDCNGCSTITGGRASCKTLRPVHTCRFCINQDFIFMCKKAIMDMHHIGRQIKP